MQRNGKLFACDRIDKQLRMNRLYSGLDHLKKYNIFISKRGAVVIY